jgi:hypothetical protein
MKLIPERAVEIRLAGDAKPSVLHDKTARF